MQAITGNFAINTSTGNQSITGLGFQPSIVLFFPTNQTADGIVDHTQTGFGVGISSTDRRSMCVRSEDNVGATTYADTDGRQDDTKCITMLSLTTAILYDADLVSLDNGGFTINVTTAPVTAYRIGYLALGGADLTKVKSGQFQGLTTPGNQSITGVGFRPDAIIFFGIASTTAPPNTITSFCNFDIGFATATTKRAALSFLAAQGSSQINTASYQQTDQCYADINSTAVDGEADFVSFDSDGFTINWTDALVDTYYVHYIAFRGGQFSVGSITSQVSPGNFSQTGVGFQPLAGLFASYCSAAGSALTTDGEFSIGAATSSAARFVAGGVNQERGTVQNSNTYNFSDATAVYANYDTAGVLEGDIDFVSWNSDGFTLNQTDADPTGNEIIYLLFGSDSRTGFVSNKLRPAIFKPGIAR